MSDNSDNEIPENGIPNPNNDSGDEQPQVPPTPKPTIKSIIPCRLISVNNPSLIQLIEGFRKYNGTTSAERWIKQFEDDLKTQNLTFKWALQNLDRIFEGNAKSWWDSLDFHNNDLPQSNGEAFIIWSDIRSQFINFFGDKAAKEAAKLQNKSLFFKFGQDPQTFVTRKIELLKLINPSISTEKIIEKLTKSLPDSFILPMTMACGDGCSIDLFLKHLRKILEIKQNISQDSPSNFSYRNNNRHPFPPKVPITNTVANTNTQSSNTNRLSLNKFFYPRAPNGEKLCAKCYQPGHLHRECTVSVTNSNNSQNYNSQSHSNFRFNNPNSYNYQRPRNRFPNYHSSYTPYQRPSFNSNFRSRNYNSYYNRVPPPNNNNNNSQQAITTVPPQTNNTIPQTPRPNNNSEN
jgi:hypothetical protein